MRCVLCSKNVLNNFVVKDKRAYHLKCLCEARDKQRMVKIERGEYYECNYCHRNCCDNYITYKGYWFHPDCFGRLLVKTVGIDKAEEIKEEVFNVSS